MIQEVIDLLLSTPLLVAIADYAVFGTSLFIFMQNRKKRLLDALLFLLMGLSFLLVGYLNSLTVLGRNFWFLRQLSASQTLAWTIMFTAIISRISKIRKLLYLTGVIIFSVLSVFFTFGYVVFSVLIPISYYIAGMAFFVLYDSSSEKMRNAGIIGLFGCFLGILATALGLPFFHPARAAIEFIFMASFLYFLKFGIARDHMIMPTKMELIEGGRGGEKAGGMIKAFAYIFCYALLLNIAVFLASVGLHEGGHLLVGNMMGCEGGKIILIDLLSPNIIGPYTEMRCPISIGGYVLGLSGFVLVIPFGIMFMLLRKFPERNIAYVVFGFALVISGLDLLLVTENPIISHVALVAGTVIICIGEVFLINDYIGYAKSRESNKGVIAEIDGAKKAEGK